MCHTVAVETTVMTVSCILIYMVVVNSPTFVQSVHVPNNHF